MCGGGQVQWAHTSAREGEILSRHHNNMTDNKGFTGEVRYWHGFV